ncbi:hypothetical protein HDV05_002828 [Chytridiales sp. JEL 0842]|nr:hypothetical protein HDV05_002828 [Chytridiales sp. JEL 0842]
MRRLDLLYPKTNLLFLLTLVNSFGYLPSHHPPEALAVVADANAEWQPINQGLPDAWHRRSLTVDALTSRVASSLVITTEGAPHPLIAKGHKLHRAQMRAILLWLLGRVAFHQVCTCGETLTRSHGITWLLSGTSFGSQPPQRTTWTNHP